MLMMVVNEITKLFMCNIIALVLVVTIYLILTIINIYRLPREKLIDLYPFGTEDRNELLRLTFTCLGINLILLIALISWVY